jgi:hypothetical protein
VDDGALDVTRDDLAEEAVRHPAILDLLNDRRASDALQVIANVSEV